MRVTHSILRDTAVTYLMRDLDELQRVQRKIATGKNYILPSENPVAATQIAHFSNRVVANEQYARAIESGVSWNEMTSTVLTQVEDLLSTIIDMSQRASNAAATSAERQQVASSVEQLLQELVMTANRQFRGKYLFGGDETLTAPFTAEYDAAGVLITGVVQNPLGIDGTWGYLVSDVDTVVINTPGDDVFQPNGEGALDDVFEIVIRLQQAHTDQDLDAAVLEEDRLRDAILHIASINGSVGTRIQHLESIGEDIDAAVLTYTDQRSKLEDTDLAEAAVEFNVAQNIYQAALSSTARILQFSLVNYL